MADTTFSTNRKGYLLSVFFTLAKEERMIPIFYIITSSEASSVLMPCLRGFKENIRNFNCLNIKICMSDMANNFYISCNAVFGSGVLHLWCAFHFHRAFKVNLLQKVKNINDRSFFKQEFYKLLDILEISDFNK